MSNFNADDVYTLLSGFFPEQLPPILNSIISKKNCNSLINNIHKNNVFKLANESKIYKMNHLDTPPSIFGSSGATESIKFFYFKNNNSLRQLSIPNLNYSILFTYNSLIVKKDLINMYHSENYESTNSESPIIGKDNLINPIEYDGISNMLKYIGNKTASSKSFRKNLINKYKKESTYTYTLKLDLSNFFENIYTHSFANIKDYFGNNNNPLISEYLEWLDVFNQKINDNHTKGILEGPISSKISAELLQFYLDQKINEKIKSLELDINFTRYVDDYTFFANDQHSLNIIKNEMAKLFRNYGLSFNDSKTKMIMSFNTPKQAHLDNYPKIKEITNKRKIFNIDSYLDLRDILTELVSNNDLPTIKSLLTIIKNRLSRNKLQIRNINISKITLQLIIKLSYIKPILCVHAFKLVNELLKNDDSHILWDTLHSNFKYIENNFSDTILEICFFYVLCNHGTLVDIFLLYNQYFEASDNISPIVLSTIISNDRTTNKIIEEFIYKKVKDDTGFKNWISQSKWWLPLVVLYEHKSITKEKFKRLFITKKGKPAIDKLGIIRYI